MPPLHGRVNLLEIWFPYFFFSSPLNGSGAIILCTQWIGSSKKLWLQDSRRLRGMRKEHAMKRIIWRLLFWRPFVLTRHCTGRLNEWNEIAKQKEKETILWRTTVLAVLVWSGRGCLVQHFRYHLQWSALPRAKPSLKKNSPKFWFL